MSTMIQKRFRYFPKLFKIYILFFLLMIVCSLVWLETNEVDQSLCIRNNDKIIIIMILIIIILILQLTIIIMIFISS